MLSPDAKTIWKSKAGASLMSAMLGLKSPDDDDRKTADELAELSREDDPPDMPDMASDRALQMTQRARGLAFDRGTVRRIDQDGRLHIEVTNISKAAVNPYLGREIPGWDELGLDPNKVYKLLRDPKELEAAAEKFNNLPVLSEHVPVSADDHRPELVVGSTGTDAGFEAPYLRNSMVIWSSKAIAGIDSGEKRELSCAYRYIPVMEPGTYEGTRYDGVMTELIGNHVALVAAGRAGADVVVGDSQLKEETSMSKPLSRRATLAKGALMGVLAADGAIDLDAILHGVTEKNWQQKKPAIIAAIKPKLAQDADIGSVVDLLNKLDTDGGAPGAQPNDDIDATDADPVEDVLALLRGKISDEDLAAVAAKVQALVGGAAPPATDIEPPTPPATPLDDDPNKKDDTPPPPAMDAAGVNKAVAAAVARAQAAARAAAEAREIVRPYVGQVAVALDTGEAVFKAALELLGVNTAGVHPSAYRAILEAQPKPGSGTRQRLAADAAPAADFATRFPALAAVK